VVAVVVSEPFFGMSASEEVRTALESTADEIKEMAARAAARRLDQVRTAASTIGVAFDAVHIYDRAPAEGILEAARERECDLIVMASHGRRGVARLFLGSQAFNVVSRATVPVLIVRATQAEFNLGDPAVLATGSQIYSRLLIATDGSDVANRAVDAGLALAKRLQASVTFVVASGAASGLDLEGVEGLGMFGTRDKIAKATERAAETILQDATRRAASVGVVHNSLHVRNKVASDAILETAAREQSDVIVMGSRGLRGVQRMMLGAQAYDVVSRAQLPVLVVR
jgi:nucleotide-binding universal stress UspA family protein